MNSYRFFSCFMIFSAAVIGVTAAPFRLMEPRNDLTTTTRAAFHVLGKADPGSSVTVNGAEAAMFSTGVFVRDNVALTSGSNELTIIVRSPSGNEQKKTVQIVREEPKAAPEPERDHLYINRDSIMPGEDLVVTYGEPVEFSFSGTPGQRASVRAGAAEFPMVELIDEATSMGTGRYRTTVVPSVTRTSGPLTLRLSATRQSRAPRLRGTRVLEMKSTAFLEVWDKSTVRIGRVKEDNTYAAYGLHDVRLGGPYAGEFCSGTLLRVVGRQGGQYHIALAPAMDAWVSAREVEIVPGAPVPHLFFTAMALDAAEQGDVISIPYSTRVPFAIDPAFAPGGNAALHIDFYGAHNAATWISQKKGAKVVRELSLEQMGTDHVRVTAELNSRQLWGFRYEVTPTHLKIYVRKAPDMVPPPQSPLAGLRIAVEAGHGGRESGARGLSGTEEKDINRMTADLLAERLRASGAVVTRIRPNDEVVPHPERFRQIMAADPQLFISLHSNAGGTERGYLGTSGISTYYKYANSRDFSTRIYERLVKLHIGDFGNVGNFNYSPLRRVTWAPTMLVEQGFMTNAADEAKLLDPKFRKEMVDAIVQGTVDFLQDARE